MTEKVPANSIAEIISKLEFENVSTKMQIEYLKSEMDLKLKAIEELAPLAEWATGSQTSPIEETNTGETK
jgi:hypothetical protein